MSHLVEEEAMCLKRKHRDKQNHLKCTDSLVGANRDCFVFSCDLSSVFLNAVGLNSDLYNHRFKKWIHRVGDKLNGGDAQLCQSFRKLEILNIEIS